MVDDVSLSIGAVAARLNVSLRTIRYYESIGIMQTHRGLGNKRYLDLDAVRRIEQVLSLQKLGLTLREIRELMRSVKPNEVPALKQSQILEQLRFLRDQRSKIQSQIVKLENMLQSVNGKPAGSGKS